MSIDRGVRNQEEDLNNINFSLSALLSILLKKFPEITDEYYDCVLRNELSYVLIEKGLESQIYKDKLIEYVSYREHIKSIRGNEYNGYNIEKYPISIPKEMGSYEEVVKYIIEKSKLTIPEQ